MGQVQIIIDNAISLAESDDVFIQILDHISITIVGIVYHSAGLGATTGMQGGGAEVA
jgi:hypothetical protein